MRHGKVFKCIILVKKNDFKGIENADGVKNEKSISQVKINILYTYHIE